MKVSSKTSPELNEPVAIFQLITTSNSSTNKENSVHFEMNRQNLSDILKQFENIQEVIANSCS
jgi:hypothetical protein